MVYQKAGQNSYVTFAILRVHNAERGNKIRNDHFTSIVLGPTCGQNGYITQTQLGDKIRKGYITPAILGATCGQNGDITPANWGVPMVLGGNQNGCMTLAYGL